VLLRRATSGELLPSARHEFLRPVPLLFWSLLALLPNTPFLLHFLNILLHAANAYLVSNLGARLGLDRKSSFIAGALFLCFPAAVEPVAWCSGVLDVIMTPAGLIFVLTTGTLPSRFGTRHLGRSVGGTPLCLFLRSR
jgi:hypothetical protein